MHPIKFRLNRTSFEEFQDGLEWNDFRNSESLCHCDASHKLSLNPTILTILYLHVATMLPTKFQYNTTFGSGGDVENVKN